MSSKQKVAWFSPLPPQKSGIANYSYWLVKALHPYVDIDLYFDGPELALDLKNEFDVYPLTAFHQKRNEYKEAVYHLGNNSLFHKEIYKLAWNYPSTIVLHDYNISAFMHEAFYLQADWRLYEEALVNRDSESARAAARHPIHRTKCRRLSDVSCSSQQEPQGYSPSSLGQGSVC